MSRKRKETRTLKQVQQEISELRAEEERLKAETFEKSIAPRLLALPGKTFVYRNNSSGGTKKWDVWRKVLTVEVSGSAGWLVCEDCETRKDFGTSKIENSVNISNPDDGGDVMPGWKECLLRDYEKAKAEVLAEISNPTKILEYLRDE